MHLLTNRLILRSMEASDWRALQRISADFAASPYRYFDHAFSLSDEAMQRLAANFSKSGLFFSVLLQGEMIGYVCFHDDGGVYDLGFSFLSSYHGKGYAYEACAALLDYFKLQGIKRFTAGTALDNAPSVRLLEKLGFVPVSEEELEFHKGHPFIGGNYRKE